MLLVIFAKDGNDPWTSLASNQAAATAAGIQPLKCEIEDKKTQRQENCETRDIACVILVVAKLA